MSDLSLLFFYTTKLDSKMIWNEFLNKKINFLTVLKIHRVYIAQLITRYATNGGAQHVCLKMKVTKEIETAYKNRKFQSKIAGREGVSEIELFENDKTNFLNNFLI